jgi:thymidylate synthase
MKPGHVTDAFRTAYMGLLWACLHGPEELNERTGHRIKQVPGGASFKLPLMDKMLPVPGVRKVYPRTAAAEIAWFLSGSQDSTWIRKYAKIWDKFVEDDGKTIAAAYGYRWRRHFNRDQIGRAVDALLDNPSDRRVFISAWDPASDGLGLPGKNVPCPVGFTFSLCAGELHSSLFIRSSDVFVGLPYDVMGHALLMGLMAETLGSRLGTMHVTLAHPHVYDSHWEMVKECQANAVGPINSIPLPTGWTIDDVAVDPDGYVQAVAEAARQVEWPEFDPRPEVIE